MRTWLIVGASRGIGLEFVRQILAKGDMVIATVRDAANGGEIYQLQKTVPLGYCQMLLCDVSSDHYIETFIEELAHASPSGLRFVPPRIDYVVMNAGVLRYPSRATEMSFAIFDEHMRTNCIGPIITAQKVLASSIEIGTLVFMSSDSSSATKFLAFEDGFAAYAASKSALNQALRHMAEELKRKNSPTIVIAMHPGEVSTDMANIDTTWNVEGVMPAEESVKAMIPVIEARARHETGTFWTWEGKQHPW